MAWRRSWFACEARASGRRRLRAARSFRAVQQLHEEIDAIADALEQVRNGEQPLLPPLEEISSEPGGSTGARERQR